jgi:ribosomal-protein-alanine N-acetyltransferase
VTAPRLDQLPDLTTARLVLRRTTPEDAPGYLAMRQANTADPEIARFLLRGAPATVGEARERLIEIDRKAREDRTLVPFTVTWAGSSELIGVVGFVRWDHEHERSEIMYELHPKHVGRGVVSEVLPPVIELGFGAMGLHRIEAHIDPRNVRSIRVAERLGFVREGVLRENTRGPGGFLDSAIYARLAPGENART